MKRIRLTHVSRNCIRISQKTKMQFNCFVYDCKKFSNNVLKFDFDVLFVRLFVNEKRCLIDV